MFNYGQQYYPQYVPQMQRLQNLEQQYPQFSQQSYPQNPQSYPQVWITSRVLIDNLHYHFT